MPVIERPRPATYRSRLYGLVLESPFPFPRELTTDQKPNAVFSEASGGVFEQARAALSARTSAPDWFEHVALPDGSDYLSWEGLFEFLVAADGSRVDFLRGPGATDTSLVTYLLGQVLSFALLKLGAEPMHATVVEVEGSAVGFLGDTGSGKSTVAAAFLAGGARLVTDDLLITRSEGERVLCEPGPPRIKLYPDIAERLLPGLPGGVPMHPETVKQVISLPPEYTVPTHGAPPLRALYVLEAPPEAPTGEQADAAPDPRLRPSVRRLRPAEAFVELVRYTFNTIVDAPDRIGRQFGAASDLSGRIPVGVLTMPPDLDLLGETRSVVLADMDR